MIPERSMRTIAQVTPWRAQLRRHTWLLLGVLPFVALVAWRLPVGLIGSAHAEPRSVAQRIDEFGAAARLRLEPRFNQAGLAWPGKRIALIGIKDESALELHVMDDRGIWHALHRYPVLAASGVAGPKLRQGDMQVPEGLYRVSFLNANSSFHVSLRLDYPNAFDRARGREDGRTDLGGDIMIHGGRASIGCLAMGDPAAEELFTLAADIGMQNIEVILAPSDFRLAPPAGTTRPSWLAGLYVQLNRSMRRFSRSLAHQKPD